MTRALPDCKVGMGIACVIKTTGAEARFQRVSLALAAEIGVTIARHHLVEDTQVIGNCCRKAAIGSGTQHQLATLCMLGLQPLQQRLVVRQ